jgi:hypothetical protein
VEFPSDPFSARLLCQGPSFLLKRVLEVWWALSFLLEWMIEVWWGSFLLNQRMSQTQLLLLCYPSAVLPRTFVSWSDFPFAAFALPRVLGAAGLIHPLPVVRVHDFPGGSACAAAVGSLETRARPMMAAVAVVAAVVGMIASPIEPGPEMKTMQ